jgi:hypothetical protein
MRPPGFIAIAAETPHLLRGRTQQIRACLDQNDLHRLFAHAALIAVGTGLFGAAIGWWRSPTQALYTAVKLPLIVLLTTSANALLNGMLAPLLGLGLSLRQCLTAVVLTFTMAAAVLGALSPIVLFLVWNTASSTSASRSVFPAYDSLILVLVVFIALAGVASHLRLLAWLRQAAGNNSVAGRVLLAWLAGNLFLGSQFAWILRPFLGSPGLPVQFLRPDALHGNFFEGVFRTLVRLLFS